MKIIISAKKIAQFLTFIVIFLITASLAGQFSKYFFGHGNLFGLVNAFDINKEFNIPAWYSAFTLMICAALLAIIALKKKVDKARYALHWQVLSLIFLYLSFDEWFSVHEKINTVLNQSLQSAPDAYWDVLNVILLSVFLIAYTKFFFHLPAKTKSLFFMAGFMFVVGAIGIELIGVSYFPNSYHQPTFFSEVIATVEELFEMLGTLIFLYALVSYMSAYVKNMRFTIVNSCSPRNKYLTAKQTIPVKIVDSVKQE